MPTETQSIVQLANERLSIEDACAMVGIEFASGNMKLYCPFGHLYHADGGMDRAFRIYPSTNSAYCFACAMAFSPVKLIATARGISLDEAADSILIETGYVPPTIDSRWSALMATATEINTDDLAEALKVACTRIDPLWEIRQFDEAVATRFRQCLGLLTKVRAEEDATKWLTMTKEIMRKVLKES